MAVPGLPQPLLLDVVSAQLVMFCFLLFFTWEPYLKGNVLPKIPSPGIRQPQWIFPRWSLLDVASARLDDGLLFAACYLFFYFYLLWWKENGPTNGMALLGSVTLLD